MSTVLLAYYCVAIVGASVVGGLLPRWLPMTHRRTEIAVSCVAGAMLGVALLHLLPHALRTAGDDPAATSNVMSCVLVGFLAMFLIERFFSFHTHDFEQPPGSDPSDESCTNCHPYSGHGISWTGAAIGLTLHSLLAGVALAASVRHAPAGAALAGLAAFLAIVLHKPLDAMTIAVLMRNSGWSTGAQAIANGLFATAVPLGVVLYHVGVAPPSEGGPTLAVGLAFSAGVFLCVSMSDLLPELHFHNHDRIALSVALGVGLGIAEIAGRLESHSHAGDSGPAQETVQLEERNASKLR